MKNSEDEIKALRKENLSENDLMLRTEVKICSQPEEEKK